MDSKPPTHRRIDLELPTELYDLACHYAAMDRVTFNQLVERLLTERLGGQEPGTE